MGTEKYANLVLQELNNSGYKDFTYIDPNRDCGYALCFIDPQGERTFISVPRCELYYQKKLFDKLNFDDYDLVYFSGYDILGTNGDVNLYV